MRQSWRGLGGGQSNESTKRKWQVETEGRTEDNPEEKWLFPDLENATGGRGVGERFLEVGNMSAEQINSWRNQ